MFSRHFVGLIALSLSACARPSPVSPGAPQQTPNNPSSSPANNASATASNTERRLTELAPEERKELAKYFEAEHVTGTIAIFDTADNKLICSDIARCKQTYLPASTFKIANTIIALETNVIEDAETSLPWDGKYAQIPEWNQDHTVRTAMRVSCVPCYRAIARKIGDQRMADWLKRLEYGNQSTEGGVDLFWLVGGLRISPIEQLDFLSRFDREKLAISPRTREIVQDVITLDVGENYVLRGKTGLADEKGKPFAGWFVGIVERGPRRIYFATVLDSRPAGVDVIPLRRRLTETILRSLGMLPA